MLRTKRPSQSVRALHSLRRTMHNAARVAPLLFRRHCALFVFTRYALPACQDTTRSIPVMTPELSQLIESYRKWRGREPITKARAHILEGGKRGTPISRDPDERRLSRRTCQPTRRAVGRACAPSVRPSVRRAVRPVRRAIRRLSRPLHTPRFAACFSCCRCTLCK